MSALEESKAAKRKINGGKQYHVKGQLKFTHLYTQISKEAARGSEEGQRRDFSCTCRGWCAVAVVAAS